MVDLHLPGPSGATLRVWPGGTRSLRLSWPTGQLPSGTWRLVAAGLDLTGTVDGDEVSWALTVDQVRAVLGQRWAVWCSTATDHPVLAGAVLEQRPLPGAGDGVTVEVAVVDGDPVVVEVGGPGGGLSEVEVQALIDAAVAGLDPGVVLSDATPQAPGAAGPGVSVEASRADHRHAPPTAGQIGAATPADIEAAIDALPGPPTALSAVSTLDMSGGSWTVLPGLGLPRMLIVGLPVLVLSGDDRGLWTVTASGPCTPLPDPGGAVIAVTAQQAVASPIVDQMGQPAGWVLGPSAEAVTVLGTTVSSLGSTVSSLGSAVTSLGAAGGAVSDRVEALVLADLLRGQSDLRTPTAWVECGAGGFGWLACSTLLPSPTASIRIRGLSRWQAFGGGPDAEALSSPLDGALGAWDLLEVAAWAAHGLVWLFWEWTESGASREWWLLENGGVFDTATATVLAGLPLAAWVEWEIEQDLTTGAVALRVRTDVEDDHTDGDGLRWRQVIRATTGGPTSIEAQAETLWIGRGGQRHQHARIRRWDDGVLVLDMDAANATDAHTIPDAVMESAPGVPAVWAAEGSGGLAEVVGAP